jgi:hypothetical protein
MPLSTCPEGTKTTLFSRAENTPQYCCQGMESLQGQQAEQEAAHSYTNPGRRQSAVVESRQLH